MRQGNGKVFYRDGSTYTGTWEANFIVGRGKATITCGDKSKKDGLPKEVSVYLTLITRLNRFSVCMVCINLKRTMHSLKMRDLLPSILVYVLMLSFYLQLQCLAHFVLAKSYLLQILLQDSYPYFIISCIDNFEGFRLLRHLWKAV